MACPAPCSLLADHEDETLHSSLWLELWRLLCMSFAPIWVCDLVYSVSLVLSDSWWKFSNCRAWLRVTGAWTYCVWRVVMIGLAGKRHLCDSVLLSNTWLFHMRVGCRAVQTRLSWITPRWEAICTGLLTTILRRQVQDGVGVVAVVWHIQMDVISCQNIALCSACSALFNFVPLSLWLF